MKLYKANIIKYEHKILKRGQNIIKLLYSE